MRSLEAPIVPFFLSIFLSFKEGGEYWDESLVNESLIELKLDYFIHHAYAILI